VLLTYVGVESSLAVEGFSRRREPVDAKVGELTPTSRAVNVIAKAMSKSEVRNIAAGRDGAPHRVCDALIGDETGCVYMTLWDDNIEKVKEGDTVSVKNGYINLFRGNMRLNIGRYGTLDIAEQPLEVEVNTENNLSNKAYERPRRSFRGRRSGYNRRRY